MRIYNRHAYVIVGAAILAVWAGPLYAPLDASAVQPAASEADVVALDRVPLIQMPEVDRELAALEDEANEAQGGPPRFAIPEPVQISPATHGIWEDLPDGRHLWRLRLRSPGATSLNLGFTRYVMPDGGQLLVYSADTNHVVRPFTAADNEAHGQLWTPVVPSDEIVVEVTLPPRAVSKLELELTSINVGYRGFGAATGGGPRVGSCNVDVICPEGDAWRDEITTVAVISTGGSTFCTGFMVNNAEQDLTPFFMTADHCSVNAGNAPSLVAYWNYENSFCRPPGSPESGQPGDGPLNMFNTGSFFRAGYSPSDFTLVELDDPANPDFHIGFAGWDNSGADASSAVAIHHPDTYEKRISFEYQPTTTTSYLGEPVPGDGTHVRVEDWDLGTTEPGSSGSPLFNQDHRVIGQLHGGDASCTSQTSDWYGKFSVSWTGGGSSSTRLSDWLDPMGTGATVVDTISGLGFQVTPANDVVHFGEMGGPFTDDTVIYTLTNYGLNPVKYSVDLNTFFGILLNGATTPVAGTLAGGGGTVDVTLTLGPDIYTLGAGVYVETVNFNDLTASNTQTRTHTVEIDQTLFSVDPDTDLLASGPEGGPFPATQVYTVTSERPTPVIVEVAASEMWVTVNGSADSVVLSLSGTGASDTATVALGPGANALPTGTHTATVSFNNLSGGGGYTTREVVLEVGRLVYPATDTPLPINDNSTTTSTITVPDDFCIGDLDVEVDISHTYIGDLIVALQSPTGTQVTLHNRSGGTAEDIVTTYDDATNPPEGPGLLADFNLSPAAGTWTLTVSDNAGADQGTLNSWSLRMVPITGECPEVTHSFPLDTDPDWDTEGQWAFGTPTGGGGTERGNPDPTSGHTGPNVYGYNLAGNYGNGIPEYHLTTNAIDCSNLTNVILKFWRYLNVETSPFDHAYVRVSNNGTTWTTVWKNTREITDSAWSQKSYNIASVADGQPTVYVRWTQGTTDGDLVYSGWNVDDVEIWGVAPTVSQTIVAGRCCADHGGATYCLDLDANNIEPRYGMSEVELDLTGDVTTVDATVGCAPGPHDGLASTSMSAGPNGPQSRVTVQFNPLPDRSCCTITLTGDVEDSYAVLTLAGDIDGSGMVNAADKNLVKGDLDAVFGASNFYYDVNISGAINATDKNLVKGWIGHTAALCP
ncbi:MAG: hypothetical protein GY778_12740 [bacterium]|nr:hypothetical protein [bacterium]